MAMPGGFEHAAGPAETDALPRWNLASIYPSFDSSRYRGDLELLREKLKVFFSRLEPGFDLARGENLLALIQAYEEAGDIAENLYAYGEAVYTADTRNSRALGELNAIETARLPLSKGAALLRCRLAENKETVLKLSETGALGPYRFFIVESLKQAAYQMSPELEDLAGDLARSGGDAWSRLQEAVSSTLRVLWDPATGEEKTVTALRDLAHSPDRAVRERAYGAELSAWKAAEIPLAAALNGVKGVSVTLDRRRGWTGNAQAGAGALRKSAFQSRLSEKTLTVLIGALESSLPLFRRYLKTKAALLGIETCAFYDLFAPVGVSAAKTWTWQDGAGCIIRQFNALDPEMGAFARRAFDASWIDAQGREGKIGGAYCTGFPLAGESRILCNFEGSFDSVTTVAHELGHAWHHELIRDLPRTLSRYPMTLAETASTFAETLLFEGALETARGPDSGAERLALIEGSLKDSCQVIVDILSRYYFEKALFERRERAELSAEELCALMIEAQEKTYGSGLDKTKLHPYMWAVKSHYYSPSLAFYNYPYAFGLLFSLGLYARFRKEGPAFAAVYRNLLRLTGRASAEEVARSAGFEIEGESFWQNGINLIARRVEELEILQRELT
jgi:pepF/M3 family oligoendopeptidase